MFAGIFLFSIFCAGEAATAATAHKQDILISSDSSYLLLKALTPPPANVADATDDVNLMPPLIPFQRSIYPTLLTPSTSIIPITSLKTTKSSRSYRNKRASIRLAARIYKKRDLFATSKQKKQSQKQKSKQQKLQRQQSQQEQSQQEQSQQEQFQQKQLQQEHLQELEFICDKCPTKRYKSFGSLQRHQRVECNKDPQHACSICRTSFYYRRTLKMHMERVHYLLLE